MSGGTIDRARSLADAVNPDERDPTFTSDTYNPIITLDLGYSYDVRHKRLIVPKENERVSYVTTWFGRQKRSGK